MALLASCQELFDSSCLYSVLGLDKSSTPAQVKKAYHKRSLAVHPDRVGEEGRELATKKFQCVGAVYAVLADEDKRAAYDETGEVEEDPLNDPNKDWEEYWRNLFPKVTLKDIKNFETEYRESVEEREDLKKAYLKAEGDMGQILDSVMCARQEDEERFREIIGEMIANKEVEKFKAFVSETKKDKKARKRAAAAEAEEAEAAAEEMGLNDENSLRNMILARQANRGAQAESFLDGLAAKYASKSKKGKTKKK